MSAAVFAVGISPINSVAPSIVGTAAVGSLLTESDGTWSGTPPPIFTRQWRRCNTGGGSCVDIAGATGTTYTPVQADTGSTIVVLVTATNVAGSTSGSSSATLIVTGPPFNTALPSIGGGTTVGSTLTEADGTWGGYPAPTFARQWERCNSGGASCANIAGATGTTYVIVAADQGGTIRVKVTGTNGSGSSSAESAATTVATPVANPVPPSIGGTTTVGSTLTEADGTWTGSPPPVLTRQWRRCDTAAPTASTSVGRPA